jgi:Ca-activated chloride channel family protein
MPAAMSLAALSLMLVSLARPRFGREQTVVTSEGIAIEMVVDRSGSMRALDFKIDGQNVDRLTAIKNVASKFISGNDDAAESDSLVFGRTGDLIGLVTFAGYADAITPPTLDHAFLVAQLDRTEIVRRRDEDGTAIGDALSLAIDKLSSLRQTDDKADKDNVNNENSSVQSKVIILLTDGENTAGEIDPVEAAKLAKTLGVKVYTIGVGTQGKAPFPVRRTRTGQILVDYIDVTIDEKTLKAIAAETGGQYFRATDTDSLKQIYDQIDSLEKTKIETQTYTDYREMAVQSVRVGGWSVPPLLLIALWLIVAAVGLKRTVFRRVGEA